MRIDKVVEGDENEGKHLDKHEDLTRLVLFVGKLVEVEHILNVLVFVQVVNLHEGCVSSQETRNQNN